MSINDAIMNENLKLFEAAKNGDLLGITRALEFGANPNFIHEQEEGAPMPLHEVVKIKDTPNGVACTKALLERGALPGAKLVSTKNTPLHEAASIGAKEICRVLVDSGALIEINGYGNTPLHSAVRAGSVEVVKLLLQRGADVNITNHLGSTSLHLCAFLAANENHKGDERDTNCIGSETVQVTPEPEGGVLVNPYLQIAAILTSSKMMKDIDATDKNGCTPLHIASQQGCTDMITLLVYRGANLTCTTSVDYKGRGGRTAALMAKSAGQTNVFDYLSRMERLAAEVGWRETLINNFDALGLES